MKVLDATFLIDYLAGIDAAAEFLVANEEEQFVFPAPAYAEVLVGEGNAPDGDLEEAKADLSWGEAYETDEETAELAGQIADEIGPQGPFLAGMDGLIAAVGRELGAPVVSFDEDLTHEETKEVIEVEEYRNSSLSPSLAKVGVELAVGTPQPSRYSVDEAFLALSP